MTFERVRGALETHFYNLTGFPDIAWDNVHYEPTQGVPFAEANLQYTLTKQSSMGPGALKEHRGILIINIYTPKDEGAQESDTYVDAVVNHFNVDDDLIFEGLTVRIRKAEPKASMERDNWFITPVVVSYYTYF